MAKKIIGIFVCMLLIASSFTFLSGNVITGKKLKAEKSDHNHEYFNDETELSSLSNNMEWPMFGHDSTLCGYSPCSIIEGNTIWEHEINGGFIDSSSVVIADGRLYVGYHEGDGQPGKVICLNAETGSHIWTSPSIGEMTLCTPAVKDDRVYISSYKEGNVCCLDTSSGQILWNYQVGDQVVGGINVVNDKIYFGSYDFNLYCLYANSGTVKWKYKTGEKIVGCPAVTNGKVFAVSMDNYIYCIDADSGSKIWKNNLGEKYIAAPTVVDNKVYVGTGYGYFYCLNENNGNTIWKSDFKFHCYSSPAVGYGKVYAGSNSGDLYCFDANNGQLLWNNDTDSEVTSPAVADGSVYLFSGYGGGGLLYRYDAETGEKIWERRVIKSIGGGGNLFNAVAIANGKIYFGSSPWDTREEISSKIYCFGSDGIDKKSKSLDYKHNNILMHLLDNFPVLSKLFQKLLFFL